MGETDAGQDYVVLCPGERRGGGPGESCGGFVARVPEEPALVYAVKHSALARKGDTVASCLRCRTKYAMRPPASRAAAA